MLDWNSVINYKIILVLFHASAHDLQESGTFWSGGSQLQNDMTEIISGFEAVLLFPKRSKP